MTYTLEQKALAVLRKQLWWRFPSGGGSDTKWTLMHDDLSQVDESDLETPCAEYHIGDDSPTTRELTELEAELLAALKEADEDFDREGFGTDSSYRDHIRAAIAKAEAA